VHTQKILIKCLDLQRNIHLVTQSLLYRNTRRQKDNYRVSELDLPLEIHLA
jgi:hypothetical protein